MTVIDAPTSSATLDPTGAAGATGHDLVFVGAGASTAYTLVALLDVLAEHPVPEVPLRLAVVDRASDAFSGLPYGDRAARTCLLITSLHDFLPDEERGRFSRWLAENKHWVFDEFHATAGAWGRTWWSRHRDAIARDDFDPIFLPRYVFGAYLKDLARRAIARAEDSGRARVSVLRDEVLGVRRDGSGYEIVGAEHRLRADRVVLAVGSPPAAPRLAEGADAADAVLLDDPFADLPAALRAVGARLDRQADQPAHPAHVVIIGGNASAMDVLYQVNDLDGAGTAVVTVLCPSGELPAKIVDHPAAPGFEPAELQALAHSETVRAAELYAAAVLDIGHGREAGFTAADTLAPVSQAVIALLPRLSPEETAEFAGRWGAQLGRHQRRAGAEYWEVVERLTAEDRFALVAGSFTGLAVASDGTTAVEYVGPDGPTQLDRPADVVVNCAGPGGDLRLAAPRLLGQLIEDGVCQPSHLGAGIAVGEGLRAADGLWVMGPLLSGNVVDGRPIWHMEHCGRISAYGTELGRRLAGELGDAEDAAA